MAWSAPPNALRNALLALGIGLLAMAGLAAGSTFWAPTRHWWDATGVSSAMTAGVQASFLAAMATAVGVMLAAAVFALLLPSLRSRPLLARHRWVPPALLRSVWPWAWHS